MTCPEPSHPGVGHLSSWECAWICERSARGHPERLQRKEDSLLFSFLDAVTKATPRGSLRAAQTCFADSSKVTLPSPQRFTSFGATFCNALQILAASVTNAHLRNVQPSFQQHIACNLRDVATMYVSTRTGPKLLDSYDEFEASRTKL